MRKDHKTKDLKKPEGGLGGGLTTGGTNTPKTRRNLKGRKPKPVRIRGGKDKQDAFCHAFLACFNASKAAEDSGYSSHHGRVLIKTPEIQIRLRELLQARLHSLDMTVERVLREESYLAFMDPIHLVDKESGRTRNLHEIPEEARRAISGYEVVDTIKRVIGGQDQKPIEEILERKYKYRFWNKGASLERMEKYLGLFIGKGSSAGWMIVIMQGEMEKPIDAGRSPEAMKMIAAAPVEVQQTVKDAMKVNIIRADIHEEPE